MNPNIAPGAQRSRPELERELQALRQQSLIAIRRGDYRSVAKFTNEAARINQLIVHLDNAENAHRPTAF